MGQSRLMHAYEQEFEAVQRETAQILLTSEDIRSRARYLNIRNTIFTLWSFGVVPIVNENDTVSFAEIRFGDNDIISAHLANMLDADLLVILTDTDGVYDRNPQRAPRRRGPAHRGEGDGHRPGRRGGQGLRVLLRRHGVEDPGGGHRHAQRRGVVIARGDGLDLGRDPGRRGDRHVVRARPPQDEGPQEVDGVQPPDRGRHRGGRRGARRPSCGRAVRCCPPG